MRRIHSFAGAALAAATAVFLTACGGVETGTEQEIKGAPGFEDLEPVELIGADSISKGAAGQIFFDKVAENVARITGGKLTIDLFHNGELGNDEELVRQMQYNDVQIMVSQTAPVVPFVPSLAALDLPMVFAKYDGDTIDAVCNGGDSEFRRKLSLGYEEAGLHLLGILQNATYRLTTANRDLSNLADFKGMQIRTMGNSNHMAFWTAIGAEPTPLAWSEVYFALQSGIIDAEENAADTIAGANLHEIQKFLACTNHILYANQICISKKAYDGLAPEYQEALNQAVNEALAEMRPVMLEIDETNKKILTDNGMTIINYDTGFFDEILELDSVKTLYKEIDDYAGGLGSVLQNSLEAESKKGK